ncbi:MAG: gamma-glutamylcyclotransferase [Phenylobacterium sp.]|nr:gamma-glutamylcyclotransferase [Phenylobacterium sp.]
MRSSTSHQWVLSLAASEKAPLDRAEGKGFGYDEIEVEVLSGTNPVRAVTYQATNTDPALRPYTWYRALVIAGAKEHGLPASYIAGLESVPADEDSSRARHDEHMALIEGVRA